MYLEKQRESEATRSQAGADAAGHTKLRARLLFGPTVRRRRRHSGKESSGHWPSSYLSLAHFRARWFAGAAALLLHLWPLGRTMPASLARPAAAEAVSGRVSVRIGSWAPVFGVVPFRRAICLTLLRFFLLEFFVLRCSGPSCFQLSTATDPDFGLASDKIRTARFTADAVLEKILGDEVVGRTVRLATASTIGHQS